MNEDVSQPVNGEVSSFALFVQSLDDGELHHDLTGCLTAIVAALNDARQAGTEKPVASMTIKLAFKLEGQTVDVIGDFATKLPKTKRERSTFWTTSRNRLSRSNPKQGALNLRDVATPSHSSIKAV